jgi:release factor glutamine methyltransferase
MDAAMLWWERPLRRTDYRLALIDKTPSAFMAETLAELLPWAVQTLAKAGIERAGFEMQLLLAQALGVSRVAVITGSYPPPNPDQLRDFVRLIVARKHHVPLAYLRGNQEFYGLPFRVTPAVLIPRPETEMLVDAARERYGAAAGAQGAPFIVADVGTGSGCIAIAILAHCPTATAVGYDLSLPALAVAKANADANGVADRFRLVQSDLLTGAHEGGYDLIVSNPPYIPTDDIATLQPEVRDYEPPLALDGGADGLECYALIAREANRALKRGGLLCVEVGQGQAAAVADLFQRAGLDDVNIKPDLAGIDRMVAGIRP